MNGKKETTTRHQQMNGKKETTTRHLSDEWEERNHDQTSTDEYFNFISKFLQMCCLKTKRANTEMVGSADQFD